MCEYYSRLITAWNLDPVRPHPPAGQDCLIWDLLPAAARDQWDFADDHCNLSNRCQKHGGVFSGTRCCIPAFCHKCGVCRFHFPYPCTPEPAAFVEDPENGACKQFSLARNDPWLNQHSKPILLAWQANTDLQPVLDREAAIKYVSKYASKPETVSEGYHHALTEFCNWMPQDLHAENAVQCLFARMAVDRDISAQEAVHLLLGEHLVECSRTFVSLDADINACHMLRNNNEADDNDPAFEQTFFNHYCARPAAQENMCAVEFCSKFNPVTGV